MGAARLSGNSDVVEGSAQRVGAQTLSDSARFVELGLMIGSSQGG